MTDGKETGGNIYFNTEADSTGKLPNVKQEWPTKIPILVIKIKTKGASGAIVIGSQKAMFSKTGDDYSGFAEVMPWEDTVMAMSELGTMIDDLQKQGDYAIDKWSR